MKTMNALTIDHVSLSFDDFRAVDDVSFSVKTGEFITLLGPSGCGKTTLLKLIGGFYQPDSGKILIDGSDVTKVPPERRDTTMCFQSYALFPHLTVAENIVFGLKQKKIRKDVRDERLREVARQVALETQLSKLPSMLSGGQQQRVALARAMAMRSGIILFDEPLSNLDAKLRDQVRFEMLQLQKSHGFTAIYVTHDQSEALAMSDTIIVLNRGRIEQIGTPDEIYKKPKNRFIADFIGTANIFEARIAEKIDGRRYIVETSMGRFAAESENPPQ
ncbi:MAG: ABC transporter ATP-binding protein, partial [Treponema sp. GWA1_62_8]